MKGGPRMCRALEEHCKAGEHQERNYVWTVS